MSFLPLTCPIPLPPSLPLPVSSLRPLSQLTLGILTSSSYTVHFQPAPFLPSQRLTLASLYLSYFIEWRTMLPKKPSIASFGVLNSVLSWTTPQLQVKEIVDVYRQRCIGYWLEENYKTNKEISIFPICLCTCCGHIASAVEEFPDFSLLSPSFSVLSSKSNIQLHTQVGVGGQKERGRGRGKE